MRILLAVSGGIDSMYMLNRASELFPEALCCVAHCNFTLRGNDSDEDERFVVDWCNCHGMECFTVRFNTARTAEERGISIEMAARDLRYEWFIKLCREHGLDAIAIAHNSNDNAETLILNILRGTGSRGLRGISAERELCGIRVLRPLLGTSREQIHEWMISNGCNWREDKSNASVEYKRNVVRNRIFPLFKQINPSFIKTLNDNIGRFCMVDDIAEDYYREAREKLCPGQQPPHTIPISGLLSLKHWEYVIYRLLEGSGIKPEQLSNLIRSLRNSKSMAGKTFGPVITSSSSILVIQADGTARPVIERLSRSEILQLKQPAGTILIDEDKLPHPFIIRKWKEGDWMVPLGMKGRKKLSDLFVDLKWNIADKQKALVVELDGSHVAALLCERIDNAVRVTDSSKNVIRIKF